MVIIMKKSILAALTVALFSAGSVSAAPATGGVSWQSVVEAAPASIFVEIDGQDLVIGTPIATGEKYLTLTEIAGNKVKIETTEFQYASFSDDVGTAISGDINVKLSAPLTQTVTPKDGAATNILGAPFTVTFGGKVLTNTAQNVPASGALKLTAANEIEVSTLPVNSTVDVSATLEIAPGSI